MPRARTATTATLRSSTGGICHARVMSHAETPASARALPSDSAPSVTASASRGHRGRRRATASPNKDLTPDVHHTVTDGGDPIAMADEDHGRPRTCAFDHGAQYPGLELGIQVRRRLVEQQYRRPGAQDPGQTEPLP